MPRWLLVRTALLCAAAVCVSHGQANLLTNGDLAAPPNERERGWQAGDGVVHLRGAEVGDFVRLKPDGRSRMKQEVAIEPGWGEMALRMTLRVRGFVAGEAAWQRAGSVAYFDGGSLEGRRYVSSPRLAEDATEWVAIESRFEVPAGAERFVLEIGNFGKAGIVDVAEVVLTPNPGIPHRPLGEEGVTVDFERPVTQGWSVAGIEGAAIVNGDGPARLRLTNDNPERFVQVKRYYAVDPAWGSLVVATRMRAEALRVGQANWQTARVQLQFVDASGNRVGPWPAAPELRDATAEWLEREVAIAIPPGAAFVMVAPGLYNATGTVEFDHLRIMPRRPATLPPGIDLLGEDGGFERPEAQARWTYNNWAGNEVAYQRTTESPVEGEFALKIDQRRMHGGPNTQLVYPLHGLKGGERLRLTFWAKGPENTPPVEVALQRRGSPWTQYQMQRFGLNDQWRQYQMNLEAPTSPGATDLLGLYFYVRGTHPLWLDDISLTGLPLQAGGEPLQGNQLVNGSFEVGRERWSVDYQAHGRIRNQVLAHEANLGNAPEIVALTGAPDGRHALRLEVREPGRVHLTSAYFDLRYGHPATLAFHVKAAPAGAATTVRARVGSGIFGRTTFYRTAVTPEPGLWTEHRYVFRPDPSPSGTYFAEMIFDHPGVYWIDAISVSEGLTPTPARDQPTVGVRPLAPQPGHLYVGRQPVRIEVLTDHPTPIALEGHVLNVWHEPLGEPIALEASAAGAPVITLPGERFGAFKLVLTEEGASSDAVPLAEWQYMVLPELPSPAASDDPFFGGHGGHGGMTPHHLDVAERVGLRSIRTHPAWNTKWIVVQPERDAWHFETAGLQRIADRGFSLVGSFDWTPSWAAGQPDDLYRSWRGSGHLPPADWALWRSYVARTAKAFSPMISAWEVWNEPDLDHWLHPPFDAALHGDSKASLYLRYVDETRRAVDEAGLDVTLIGGALARADDALMDTLLNAGLADRVDAVSFHLYGAKPLALRPLVDRLAAMRGRSGEPLRVWQTEGAFNIPARTWLRTVRNPEAVPSSVPKLVAGFAAQLAVLKAIGVERNYHYPAPNAHPYGRVTYRNDFAYGDDVMGNPLPLWAAHAAAVKMLDGARPMDQPALTSTPHGQATVWRAAFERSNRRIDVVWSDGGRVPLERLDIAAEAVLIDAMGNPMASRRGLAVDERPIYIETPAD